MNVRPAEMSARLLVVDDTVAIHEDFRKILCLGAPPPADLNAIETELFGEPALEAGPQPEFRIDSAYQGREALALVRQAGAEASPYAVAFVDVRMPPGWDGIETIEKLWAVDPALEIVLCTAYSDHSWRQIVKRLGCTDQLVVLKKPFEPTEVRQLALALSVKWRLKREQAARQSRLEEACRLRNIELEEQNRRLEETIREHELTLRDLVASNEVRGEQARVLGILLDVSQRLVDAQDVPAVIRHIVAATARLTGCRRISVMLPDAQGQHLVIAGGIGLSEELRRTVRVPVGGAIAGKVFATGTAIVVNARGDERLTSPEYDSRFFVSVPLLSRALVASEHVVGVLNITEREGGQPFLPRELGHIETICNMAAAAIHGIQARDARDAARDSIVTALATLVEYRDGTTGRHLDRVTGYSVLLADAMREVERFRREITDTFVSDLRRAVPLHDIGKVAIPDQILGKRGRLGADEMNVMQRHTRIGERVIRATEESVPGAHFLRLAADIARSHHERFDGTGYPEGLAGDAIPLAARIVALADVYDALTSKRPYKEAYPHEKAAAIIEEGRGTQFDPDVVDAFLRRQAEFRKLAARLADEDADAVDRLLPELVGA